MSVKPPYVEVLGAQVVVRYQGENSVILKLLRVIETLLFFQIQHSFPYI
jgi:hypothetical protein